MYGTHGAAAKQMHISKALLYKAAHAPRGWEPTDREAKALQKGLGHIGERKLAVAEKYARKARAHFDINQLKNAARSSRRGLKGREYFMEQVEKYRVNRPPRYKHSLPGEGPAPEDKSPLKRTRKRTKRTRKSELKKRERENGKRSRARATIRRSRR